MSFNDDTVILCEQYKVSSFLWGTFEDLRFGWMALAYSTSFALVFTIANEIELSRYFEERRGDLFQATIWHHYLHDQVQSNLRIKTLHFQTLPVSVSLLLLTSWKKLCRISFQRNELIALDLDYVFVLLQVLPSSLRSLCRNLSRLKTGGFKVSALLRWHNVVWFLNVDTLKFFLSSLLKHWKD